MPSSIDDDDFFDAPEFGGFTLSDQRLSLDVKTNGNAMATTSNTTLHSPTSSASSTNSNNNNRSKLANLRDRINADFADAEFLPISLLAPDSSIGDQQSIASWGKHFLHQFPAPAADADSKDSSAFLLKPAAVVVPYDTISTRGGGSTAEMTHGPAQYAHHSSSTSAASLNNNQVPVPVHSTVITTENASTSTKPRSPSDASTSTILAEHSPKTNSNNNSGVLSEDYCRSSSASSKSNTLERYSTPSSKTNSLDRSAITFKTLSSSGYAAACSSTSRSSSFNGMFNRSGDIPEDELAAVVERKNSAAAELIEALTSRIIREQQQETAVPSASGDVLNNVSSDSVRPVPPPRVKRKCRTLKKESSISSSLTRNDSTASTSTAASCAIKNSDTTVGNAQHHSLADGKQSKSSVCLLQHPLSQQMIDRTAVHSDGIQPSDDLSEDSDETESVMSYDVGEAAQSKLKGKQHVIVQAKATTSRAKRIFGRAVEKTISKLKQVTDGNKPEAVSEEECEEYDNRNTIRVRTSKQNKGPYEFDQIKLVQDLSGATGAVWCVRFSHCGRLLATAGQDKTIRIWVLKSSSTHFLAMRQKYNSGESSLGIMGLGSYTAPVNSEDEQSLEYSTPPSPAKSNSSSIELDDCWAPFAAKPFCLYRGHAADVLDLSWSKNFFLLSSSMDRTVRLWHLSRNECLCCFQHIDFVTSLAFLPKDDRYFLSASLDGKLRLWNIPEKRVVLWNEVDNGQLITAMTFVTSGKYVVVGTYDGRCIFYTAELKYFTQILVKSSRGKNARGHKITGLEAAPDKLLVTSNDSRIRLYDLRDLSLTCKYKGYINGESQIKASFSNFKYITCGSEDQSVYFWRTSVDSLAMRRDRNSLWESVRAHKAVVTAALFAPRPAIIFDQIEQSRITSGIRMADASLSEAATISSSLPPSKTMGEVIVSADFNGQILVFVNKAKVKAGSSTFFPSF